MPEQKDKAAAKAGAERKTIIQTLELSKKQISARLPANINKDQFILGLFTAINKSKATAAVGKSLADCDPNKVLLAAIEAAELGCSLNPSLGLGWLIPFGGEVSFIPSYRFFIQRAYQTREVKTFFAEVVYEGDKCDRQYAPKKNLFHAPGDGPRDRDHAIAVYALIEFADGTIDWEYMTREQVDRHRKHSKQPNSMVWTDFWEEGWRKTPIRVLAKRLPLKDRDLEKLIELVDRDTANDLVIPAEQIAELPEPRRLPEPESGAPASAEAQQEERPKEQPKGDAKPKANGGTTSMFNEGDDPFLSPQEANDFWSKAFEANMTKQQVTDLLRREYNVSSPKEIRRSQAQKILEVIQQGSRE